MMIIDDSDKNPDFCLENPRPNVRGFPVFNSSTEVAPLINSDSETLTLIGRSCKKKG